LLKKILAKISKAHRPQIAVGGKSNFPVPPWIVKKIRASTNQQWSLIVVG
jgi:hypothetical protein